MSAPAFCVEAPGRVLVWWRRSGSSPDPCGPCRRRLRGARCLCRPGSWGEELGWAGEHAPFTVSDPTESESAAGGIGAVRVDVRGVVLVMQGFGDRAGVDGAGEGSGLVVVKPDEDRCREEVHRLAAEHQVFGVAQR